MLAIWKCANTESRRIQLHHVSLVVYKMACNLQTKNDAYRNNYSKALYLKFLYGPFPHPPPIKFQWKAFFKTIYLYNMA